MPIPNSDFRPLRHGAIGRRIALNRLDFYRGFETICGDSLLPLSDLGDADELGESVCRLISAVIVHAPPDSETLEVEIRGRLDELARGANVRAPFRRGLVVAGEGLEPPTPGL
jgi:hypothetical protein